VAAGEIGSGAGMALFSKSLSGNNFGLLEFKWEIRLTDSGWTACGVKLASKGSYRAILLACSPKRQVAFLYIDLNT